MSSRTRVIAGFIVLAFITFIWNNVLFQGAHMGPVQDMAIPAAITASPLHLPWFVIAGVFILWYAMNWVNIVNEWNRRPVMLFGRYARTLGPGIQLLEPIMFTTLYDRSIQDQVVSLQIEGMQTKDNVPVGMTAVLTYAHDPNRIRDSVVNVDDVEEATQTRALSTITDLGGSRNLEQLLEHRDTFCSDMANRLSERVKAWGIVIKAVELRDFAIGDEDIARAIAMKARAKKEGEAEVERARFQLEVAKTLDEAGREYSADGWKLKAFETLLEMTRSAANNTVLIPSNLLGGVTEALERLAGMSAAPNSGEAPPLRPAA